MRPQRESGYALLLVLAMAASVAIMLYMELPRLVFESQRITEQDLVFRGEEYQRAIQLFVRKQRRYPATLDELESTDNVRYLRRRYADPMTGEEEWRLINIDSAGFFTDSLLHDPAGEPEEETSQNTFITEGPAFGSTAPLPGTEGVGSGVGADVQGASDRPVVTAEQFFGVPGAGFPGQPGAPQPNPNVPAGLGQYPTPGQQPATQGGQGQTPQYPYPQAGIPGIPGLPGPYGQQPTPGAPVPTGPQFTAPQQPPARPSPTPPAGAPGQASNAAVDLIRTILTTPRQSALPGAQAGQLGGQTVAGGIAGVASTLEVEGIMVYNERTKYNEWEFLYDYRADQTAGAAAAPQGGEAAGAAGRTGRERGSGQADSQSGSFGGGQRGRGAGQRGGGRGGFGGGGFGGGPGGQPGQFPPTGPPRAPGGRGR